MTVGERIKELRNSLGMSQVDFADRINVSKQTLYKYENNIITNIPSDKIESAAQIGNVSPAYLMGWDINAKEKKESIKQGVIINVYGRVAAGIPIEAIQDIIDEEEIPEETVEEEVSVEEVEEEHAETEVPISLAPTTCEDMLYEMEDALSAAIWRWNNCKSTYPEHLKSRTGQQQVKKLADEAIKFFREVKQGGLWK